MRPLADKLLAKGHAVLALRLPGHGSAPHDMYGYKVTDWMDSAVRNLNILTGHVAPGTPVNVVGYSTGGLIALALTQIRPEIARVAALAPALQLVNWQRHLLRPALLINRLVSSIFGWWIPPVSHGLVPWFKLQAGPESSYRRIPLPAIRQLEKLAGHVSGGMVPAAALLLMHGTADTTTSASATSTLFSRWNTGTLKLLDGVPHGLLDPEHADVLDDVVEFIHAKK
jgi:carboxylesterase